MLFSEHTQELPVDLASARQRAAVDINFFAGLCLPDTFLFPFPRYYVALFQFLVHAINNEQIIQVLRIAIGLPRGFAKTTFFKVIVVWLIVHDKYSFIAVICATEPHAENFVGDIYSILCSPNIVELYGDFKKRQITDNKGLKKSQFRNRMVIIVGAGAGSSVRGIAIDNKRPEVILCDDMQTKDNDANPTLSQELLEWAVGTLFKIVTPFKSLILYVGNMYSTGCLLYKFKEHPDWLSLITGCILESGESLWPELHPLEALYANFKHDEQLGQADTWFAEMMNDPITRSDALLEGRLPMKVYDGVIEPEAAFITIDVAGFKDGADDNVITGHQILNNHYHIAEMDGGKWDPGTVIRNSVQMCVRLQGNLIGVEDVAYQGTLTYWFQKYFEDQHINGIHAVGLKIGTVAKERRIRTFIKEMYAGEYSFLREIDRMKFTWQAAQYRSGKKKNKDDWLDSPALGLVVRNQFRHMLQIRTEEQAKSPGVMINNTPF